ncbi:MAG: thioredoxin-dependent thiol peroxidase [Armatimonadetes bacterium]|nr:thioredoxin-dependent thiol peroxidase [Armatimonadota bacterium]
MPELREGDRAPAFELPASTGGTMALSDFQGRQKLVLYFYPRDMTAGCTKEACSFRDLQEEFAEAGAAIVGVSTDDLKSHDKFAAKHELTFPLLADTDAAVAHAYGVWKEKNTYGKKHMGIERTTFVIDAKGVIRKIYRKVKVDEHADAVLAAVRELG